MGMFNYVKVENEMMPEKYRAQEFQTKEDLEDLYLETYTITKEGRLMFERKTYEWKPDPKKKKLNGFFAKYGGALKTKSSTMVDENFHGDFHFYSGINPKSAKDIECVARFTNGQLESISRKPWKA